MTKKDFKIYEKGHLAGYEKGLRDGTNYQKRIFIDWSFVIMTGLLLLFSTIFIILVKDFNVVIITAMFILGLIAMLAFFKKVMEEELKQ